MNLLLAALLIKRENATCINGSWSASAASIVETRNSNSTVARAGGPGVTPDARVAAASWSASFFNAFWQYLQMMLQREGNMVQSMRPAALSCSNPHEMCLTTPLFTRSITNALTTWKRKPHSVSSPPTKNKNTTPPPTVSDDTP